MGSALDAGSAQISGHPPGPQKMVPISALWEKANSARISGHPLGPQKMVPISGHPARLLGGGGLLSAAGAKIFEIICTEGEFFSDICGCNLWVARPDAASPAICQFFVGGWVFRVCGRTFLKPREFFIFLKESSPQGQGRSQFSAPVPSAPGKLKMTHMHNFRSKMFKNMFLDHMMTYYCVFDRNQELPHPT